jgi:hypothetical protein
MMQDLDLLVPQIRLAEAVVALGELGYAPISQPATIAHHYPALALAHPHHRAVLEFHGELLAKQRQQRLLTAAELIEASRPIVFDNLRARLPSVSIRSFTSSRIVRSSTVGTPSAALRCAIGWKPRHCCADPPTACGGGRFLTGLPRPATGDRC